MRIPLGHFKAFYKKLIEFADSDGNILSFIKSRITTIQNYVPSAGDYNEHNLLNEIKHPDYDIYKAPSLIKVFHDIKHDKVDISLVEMEDHVTGIDIINVGNIYDQRKAVAKLDQLADLKQRLLKGQPVSREYSSTQIDNRIYFYLDVLKASKFGVEAAYQWCKSKDSSIITMPADIVLGKAVLQHYHPITFSKVCRRQFNHKKRDY